MKNIWHGTRLKLLFNPYKLQPSTVLWWVIVTVTILSWFTPQKDIHHYWKPQPIRFELIRSNTCSNFSRSGELDKKLLVIVRSTPDRFDRRNEIRQTWGHPCWADRFRYRYHVIFITGQQDSAHVEATNRRLYEESMEFNDIVQYNLTDNYFSLTIKMFAAWTFVQLYCPQVEYVFFSDDDIVVNPINLMEFLNYIPPEQQDNYVGGYLYGSLRPTRCAIMKNSISIEEYPYPYLPPFVAGGAVLMSRAMTNRLLHQLPNLDRMLPMEDVNIGQLMKQMKECPKKLPQICLRDIDCNRMAIEDVIAIHKCPKTAGLVQKWDVFKSTLKC